MTTPSDIIFENVLELMPAGCLVVDNLGLVVYANRAAAEMLGFTVEELIGVSIQSHLVAQNMTDLGVKEGETSRCSFLTKSEQVIEIDVSARPYDSSSGMQVLVLYNATKCRHTEEQLRQSRDFYLTLFEDFPALIWRSGTDAECNYFNKAWLEFTGRTTEQEIGNGWAEGVHADDFDHCLSTYTSAFAAQRPFEMEYRLRRHDGEYRWILDIGKPYHDLDGSFAGYIGSCYDITDRKLLEDSLRQQAHYDPLTGLTNRYLFYQRGERQLLRTRFSGGHIACLFLDIDNFKGINDSYGHLVGDGLLQAFAERLTQTLRADDTVCRFGGDEFVVLVNVATPEKADLVAKKIHKAVHIPFHIENVDIRATASIGISISPRDGDTLAQLLQAADNALYHSKQSGKDTYRFAG